MLDSLKIARRIKSRFRSIGGAYAAGPIANGRDALVDLITDGRTFRAHVSPILHLDDVRPVGFDHIFGERPRIDQLRLAEMASRSVGLLAGVSNRDEDVAELEPWHKAGRAGFVVRCAHGGRFLVEIEEVQPLRLPEEAEAAAGIS